MPMVQISETYDLSTTQDKMGLIGIHTPSFSVIKTMWGGLCQNYKFVRIVACDVALACASMLPVDPLQIGTSAGSIAPQDMFNPMLYRAVSNDAFETILARIYSNTNSNDQGSVKSNNFDMDSMQTEADQWDLYYGVLGDPSWRKAMPQAGLEMRGLFPLVYSVVNTYGPTGLATGIADLDKVTTLAQAGNAASTAIAGNIRGPPMRMPRIPTRVKPDQTNPIIPTVYVGAIITPPAKLNKLYYRMRVTWTVEFTDLISTPARSSVVDLAESRLYWSDWVYGSNAKDVEKLTDANLASTKDVEIKTVMAS